VSFRLLCVQLHSLPFALSYSGPARLLGRFRVAGFGGGTERSQMLLLDRAAPNTAPRAGAVLCRLHQWRHVPVAPARIPSYSCSADSSLSWESRSENAQALNLKPEPPVHKPVSGELVRAQPPKAPDSRSATAAPCHKPANALHAGAGPCAWRAGWFPSQKVLRWRDGLRRNPAHNARTF